MLEDLSKTVQGNFLLLSLLLPHTAAKVILLKCKSHYVTTLLMCLQWLSTSLKIMPKFLQWHKRPYTIFLLLLLFTSLMSSPITLPSSHILVYSQWPLVFMPSMFLPQSNCTCGISEERFPDLYS